MNILSFNKTNPNLTLISFKEHKSTSSETQKNTNLWRRKKEKGKKREKSYPERKRKKKKLPRCEEGRKKNKKKKKIERRTWRVVMVEWVKNEERKRKEGEKKEKMKTSVGGKVGM